MAWLKISVACFRCCALICSTRANSFGPLWSAQFESVFCLASNALLPAGATVLPRDVENQSPRAAGSVSHNHVPCPDTLPIMRVELQSCLQVLRGPIGLPLF